MSELSHELQQKILQAHSTASNPSAQRLIAFRNIGHLLKEQADRQEQNPYLIFYDDAGHRVEYTYREFFEEACKAAHLLLSHGIRPGDRVATVSFNHADVVVQYFAAFLLGAVVVPINLGEDDKRITFILQNSGTRFAFVRSEFLQRIEALHGQVPALDTVMQVGGSPDHRHPHYESELKRQPTSAPLHEAGLTDDALIVYTSGTTGLPKGVLLTQYNLMVDAMAITEWHGISSDQRLMCVLPIHHVNGTIVTLMTPMYAGCGVVLNQKFHTDRFFERISIEKVSIVSVVPTLLQFLLHSNIAVEGYKLTHFRHIICGAGPLTVDLVQKFEQEFSIPVIHGYGLSETTCYSCFLPVDLPVEAHRFWLSQHGFPSIGVPLPVNEMAIHDPNGIACEEGVRGEIVIRGHNVMKNYFLNPEANEKAFTHGWFRSGDEGFFRYDEEGRMFFFITGRIKELIIRGGVNISPFEIDEVISGIPGVQAGIAVGFENDWYGEEVGAMVLLKPGTAISEEDILAACRKQLPYHKSPKVVLFGNELPVTSTGKYQRGKCRDLFAPWKSVQFTPPK
jgi:long-chain acyl-CoA synthetase